MSGRLYSVAQVCERWGVQQRMVRTLIAGGKLPVVRLSARCLRIREADVERFERERLQGGGR